MTDAHDNNDITKVRMKYGAEGYAIYFYCLELIAGDLGTSSEITFELKHDAEVIAYNLKLDSLRVEEIMIYMVNLGLFESSNSIVTCFKLAKYLDKKTTRNKKILEIIDTAGRKEALSRIVPDKSELSGNVRDCPDTIPLDTDTDTDTDTEFINKKIKNKKTKNKTRKKFIPPSIDDVAIYCMERKNNIDPDHFVDYQLARDWILSNGKKMVCWKATIRNWERNNFSTGGNNNVGKGKSAVDLVREANNMDEHVSEKEIIDITADVERVPDR